jgi:hypothetical protein
MPIRMTFGWEGFHFWRLDTAMRYPHSTSLEHVQSIASPMLLLVAVRNNELGLEAYLTFPPGPSYVVATEGAMPGHCLADSNAIS